MGGCTDDNADGRYRLDLYNRDDGCSFGWTPGGTFSTGLIVAQYDDDDREYVLAVMGSAPVADVLDVRALVFAGETMPGELLVYSDDEVDTETCHYFYSVELRADVRPNRFKNLLGQVTYTLRTLPNSPGCSDHCVSVQDLEGERL